MSDSGVYMFCADESGAYRLFIPEVDGDGRSTGDHTCTECGWMQRSFAEGKIELAANRLGQNDQDAINVALAILNMKGAMRDQH